MNTILKSLFLSLFFSLSLWAAPPNSAILFTDGMADDREGLTNQITDLNSRQRIVMVVVTSGNTHLRKAVLEQDLRGLGLDIPVYAGTSTDLSENLGTEFAANFSKEGFHTLVGKEIQKLKKMHLTHGDGAQKAGELIVSYPQGKKLDVICMAPVIDLVGAIKVAGLEHSRRVLGDLNANGLYKRTAQGLVLPFNGVTGASHLHDLYHLFQAGVFENFIHIPSDTFQLRSGIPGGYLPAAGRGGELRLRIQLAMFRHPALYQQLLSATEHAMSFFDYAVREWGTGLADNAFIPDNYKGGRDQIGSYLADLSISYVSKLPLVEILQLPHSETLLELTFEDGKPGLHALEVAPGDSKRRIIDIEQIDGFRIYEEYATLLEAAGQFQPHTKFISVAKPIASSDPASSSTDAAEMFLAPVLQASVAKSPLIVNFKNSPDDWFALLGVLAIPELRKALRYGGVICERYEEDVVVNAVRNLLATVGEPTIPVVKGYLYVPGELDPIPNFQGELFLHQTGELVRAFTQLPVIRVENELTPTQLFERAAKNAKQNKTKVNQIVLGEGVDFFRFFKAHSEHNSQWGTAVMMNGGRLPTPQSPPETPLIPTRNLLPHQQEVLEGMYALALQKDAVVAVASSNELGGNLSAIMPEGRLAGNQGTGAPILNVLIELGKTQPIFQAIVDHWVNWTRGFAHFMAEKSRKDAHVKAEDLRRKNTPDDTPFVENPFEPIAFDRDKPTHSLTISPIGVEVFLKLLALQSGVTPLHKMVSLKEKIESPFVEKAIAPNIMWLIRDSGEDHLARIHQLSGSMGKIAQTTAMSALDTAVREQGPFSDDAIQGFQNVAQLSCPDQIAPQTGNPAPPDEKSK